MENLASSTANSSLFDKFGRAVPQTTQGAVHVATRRRFVCEQPTLDYGAIHARLIKHLAPNATISASDFESRAQAILAKLRKDAKTASITDGVCVPFLLPQGRVDNYGKELEEKYVLAVGESYHATLPSYSFVNHCKVTLSGKVTVVPESRHQRVLDAMSNDVVVGYYFPCLLEYSIAAAIAQTQASSDALLLAGGLDTCAAFVGSPDLLMRKDGYPPMLWFAALLGDEPGIAYHLEAYGYNLTFNRRPHFNHAAEYWGSGMVVLG